MKMNQFRNTPNLKNENHEGMVKRYSHQPLSIEHYGLHAKIQENGRVLIRSAGEAVKGSDEVEYDEVEVPASLIFKLANLLKDTRSVKYVPISEAAKMPAVEHENS